MIQYTFSTVSVVSVVPEVVSMVVSVVDQAADLGVGKDRDGEADRAGGRARAVEGEGGVGGSGEVIRIRGDVM